MNLSLNWLKEFVDVPRKITAEELAKRLTLHTVEVEGVVSQSEKYKNVVIGKILEIKKHPNADRLSLATVNVGDKKLEIVCGASNIEAGQMVPVALVGAVLPNGIEIKEAEVRGVMSAGMLCAEDELGLGEDHSGIMILDKGAKIGKGFADYLGINDIVLEVDNKSLTNRPDLWSHYGMARDIAAFLGVKYRPLKFTGVGFADYFKKDLDSKKLKLDIKVDDNALCPRYMAIAVDGIKIEPSPKWIEDRIIAAGSRPINNIVDATNYVMLELGQPLHAFDRQLVDRIIVRAAKNGEEIDNLDGQKRSLTSSDLVIADSQKPIAIAGVMGGTNSEISPETTSIIIESANFDFASIRKTSQRLDLRTEASIRYEKSLDPNLCELALIRIVEIIKKICPKAEISSLLTDESKFSLNQGPIILDPKWLSHFVGEKIKAGQAIKVLASLGFDVKPAENKLEVMVPSWRATKDISIREDLAEEVIRIIGYDKIPSSMPEIRIDPPAVIEELELERRLKNILSEGLKLTEVYNYSFVGEADLKKLGLDYSTHIRLANPISTQCTMLRQNLAPNIISNIKLNQARFERIEIFEIGNIYLSTAGEVDKDKNSTEKLPYQEKRLGLAVSNRDFDQAYDKVKGMMLYMGKRLGLEMLFRPSETMPAWAEKGYNAEIICGGRRLGLVSRLSEIAKRSVNIKKEVAIAEINLRELLQLYRNRRPDKFREFEKFPPVMRDLAFVVNQKVLYNDINEEIVNFNQLVDNAELFDFYEGGKLGEGMKSVAFHIVYRSDKTLTTAEIDEVQNAMIKRMEEKFGAKVRDF
jgi:phenylalanyl-tRNA synthetase beta chain